MKKASFLIIPLVAIFYFGRFFGSSDLLPQSHSGNIHKPEVAKNISKPEDPSKDIQGSSPGEDSALVNGKSLSDKMAEADQDIFYTIFEPSFWSKMESEGLDKITEAYTQLSLKPNRREGHSDRRHRYVRTQLGVLKAMGELFLDPEMNEKLRKQSLQFHEEILKTEKNIFIRRQALANLNKILKFDNEEQRINYMEKVDKQALYLSTLSVDDIVEKVLGNE